MCVVLKKVDNVIAHIRKSGEQQSLWTHLEETLRFAGEFAGKIGLKECGERSFLKTGQQAGEFYDSTKQTL